MITFVGFEFRRDMLLSGNNNVLTAVFFFKASFLHKEILFVSMNLFLQCNCGRYNLLLLAMENNLILLVIVESLESYPKVIF